MIFVWIALGAVAGTLPLRRVQWNVAHGLMAGVAGAILGGWLHTRAVSGDAKYFFIGSAAASLGGAALVLAAYGYTASRRS